MADRQFNNEENRLVEVKGPDGRWAYEYDALGNRIAVTHDGIRQAFVVDPIVRIGSLAIPSVTQIYEDVSSPVATYVYGNQLVSSIDQSSSEIYFDTDLSGNVISATGPAGTPLFVKSYLPFGENLSVDGPQVGPFQYAGGVGALSDGTGGVFLRTRSYGVLVMSYFCAAA